MFKGFSVKTPDNKSKIYSVTKQLFEYCQVDTIENQDWEDVSNYDLCPAVELWTGTGNYNNKEYYDIYFRVNDSAHLQEVADYYNLSFPLPDDIDMDSNNFEWHSGTLKSMIYRLNRDKFNTETNFKVGSVRFVGGVATLFKVYKSNHKDKEY